MSTYNYTYGGTDTNELLAQTTPDGSYTYTYGRTTPEGVPMIESATKDGRSASVLSDPVTGQPLMLRTTTGAQSLYIYDGTPGSPVALLTSSAYVAFAYDYDPFGVPTLTKDSGGDGKPQNPYTFAGGLQDRTTGWVHFGNRYYNAKTGSFTQQDALDAPLDPANANRYAYAGNDPLNNIDPTGLRSCGLSIALAGASTFAYFGGGASLISTGVGAPLGISLFAVGAFSLPYSYPGCLRVVQVSTKRSYQLMALTGVLLGFVGLANLGYVLAGEPLTTGTVVLIVGGLAGIILGVVAAMRARQTDPKDKG